jgi:hypothetical protein
MSIQLSGPWWAWALILVGFMALHMRLTVALSTMVIGEIASTAKKEREEEAAQQVAAAEKFLAEQQSPGLTIVQDPDGPGL